MRQSQLALPPHPPEKEQLILPPPEAQGHLSMFEIGFIIGFERGYRQGRLQMARHILMDLIHMHFRALFGFAEQQAWDVNDLEVLHDAIISLFDASTIEQARQVLAQITEK